MKSKLCVWLLVLTALGTQNVLATATTANSTYCNIPPYLTSSVKPNIHFIFDHSGSFGFYPYVLMNQVPGSATNVTYPATTGYYGYFAKDKYYKYDTAVSSGTWVVNTACTGETDLIGGKTAGQQCISGNLLNFVTSSRIDIVRKIMTGGRVLSSSAADIFVHEGENQYKGYSDGTLGNPITIDSLNCKFTLGRTTVWNVDNDGTSPFTHNATITIDNKGVGAGNACAVGTQAAANIQVRGTAPGTTTGLIPNLYPNLADIEFSFFSGGKTAATPDVKKVAYDGSYGITAYSTVKNQPLANYLNALNYSRMWGGTPTGTAMAEAQKFFQQTAVATTETSPSGGTTLINKTNANADPYYDLVDGSSTAAPCRKSFILLVSDGEWSGSDPADFALHMHTVDQRPEAAMADPQHQLVTTYAVYAFGAKDAPGASGRNSLIATAMLGGFSDKGPANNLPYGYATNLATTLAAVKGSCTYPGTRCAKWPITTANGYSGNCYPGSGFPSTAWDANCSEWDKSPEPHTGLPYNFYEADDGDALASALASAVQDILAKVSSGTAASILGNNDNNGSSLLQAIFYKEKPFDNSTKASWAGEVQAFWYYIDPKLDNITIREDTVTDRKLKLADDRILEFTFDGKDTLVNLYNDSLGNGTKNPTSIYSTVDPTAVKTLWRAGNSLWSRSPGDRSIFTNDPTATTATKLSFDTTAGTVTKLSPYLDVTPATAPDIINYIRGSDVSTAYRKRAITIGTTSDIWKLGDIINSTPKLLSEVRLNSYNLKAPNGYSDLSYEKYIKSKDYDARGEVYVGANDGMLHAFKTGSNFIGSTQGVVAEIKDSYTNPATDLGKELWAFIPKSTLPYLQYLGDFDNVGYKHLYYVDQTPLLVDASINPTKYRVNSSTVLTCDASSTGATPYSSCARTANVNGSTRQLSYDIATDPTVTGASLGTSWRTILLGSTGMGGATRKSQALSKGVGITINAAGKTFTRTVGSFLDDGWAAGKIFTSAKFANTGNNRTFTISAVTANVITCDSAAGLVNETAVADIVESAVKTPIMDPADATRGFGYASYFALDVTNPIVSDLISPAVYPRLLWEFSDPKLGFATAAPAIVRIKDGNDDGNPPRNGKWFAIIASGPTGPIDTTYNQFLGYSDQPLQIWVLDLKTGAVVRTFSKSAGSTATPAYSVPDNAFAGNLTASTIDTDKWKAGPNLHGVYSDDSIYIGYTRLDAAAGTWSKGGVLRLLTNNDPDPANWKLSTLMDGIGPVTAAVTKLQDISAHNLWLYFGTGRYFYKTGGTVDDAASRQALYGIKDPCYVYQPFGSLKNTFDPACTTQVSASNLQNQTTISTPDSTKNGWYINLAAEDAAAGFKAERVITDPVASGTGAVFFTTFMPSTQLCGYGGQTTIWAANYSSGGVAPANLKGQLLIQLSTGAFQQVDLSTAFTGSEDRRTPPYKGVPPRNQPALTSNANHFPSKRVLHIQER
jgi:Tfp pilus tip-associated adhesin PilY1